MKLSNLELQLLTYLEHRPRLSIVAAAKYLGEREHVVRYAINNLRQNEIFGEVLPVINPGALGISEYLLYFSLVAPRKKQRENLLEYMKVSERVTWLAEIGGDFEYGSTIAARRADDITDFLLKASPSMGAIIQNRAFGVRTEFTFFGRRFLAPAVSTQEIKAPRGAKIVEIDDVDVKILRQLSSSKEISDREHARMLNISITTFERRLRHLQEQGVICGFIRRIRLRQFGIQSFKFLVSCRGVSSLLTQIVLSFCRKEPNITNALQCIGQWDFELRVELPPSENPTKITARLYDALGDQLNGVKVIPVFDTFKFSPLPAFE